MDTFALIAVVTLVALLVVNTLYTIFTAGDARSADSKVEQSLRELEMNRLFMQQIETRVKGLSGDQRAILEAVVSVTETLAPLMNLKTADRTAILLRDLMEEGPLPLPDEQVAESQSAEAQG